MRTQYLPVLGITVVFLFGIALLFGAVYPISGDVFSFFEPFYIYLGTWLLLAAIWCIFVPSHRIAVLIFVGVILVLGCVLPFATLAKFGHNRLLYDAARYDHLIILKVELAFDGKQKTDLDDALINSSLGGKTRIVEFLLLNGADPNARLFDNNTALMLAVQSKSTDTVRLLLRSGADINAINKDGMTALMWAAQTNASEPARVLLEANADKKLRNNNGESASTLSRKLHFDQMEKILSQ